MATDSLTGNDGDDGPRGQTLFPVVDEARQLIGAITRRKLHKLRDDASVQTRPLAGLIDEKPVVAYANEPLRVVVYRMAETGLTRFPVLAGENSRQLMGMVSLNDLLRARTRSLEEERHRERVIRIRLPFRRRAAARVE